MILGIGVDICKIARIQRILTKSAYSHERFLTGTFHESEVAEYRAKEAEQVKVQFLASRWALKEAMVKASGRTDLDYTGIYLKKEKSNGASRLSKAPVLSISGDKNKRIFEEELKVCSMHASLSHEEDYAVAFVTLETLVKL